MEYRMVVLVIRTKDDHLQHCYRQYMDVSQRSASREIAFNKKVGLLEQLGIWGEEINNRIAYLAKQGTPIELIDESLISLITTTELRNRMKNGIFEVNELRRLTGNDDVLRPELKESLNRILTGSNDEEIVMFWNIGELEANGLLQTP